MIKPGFTIGWNPAPECEIKVANYRVFNEMQQLSFDLLADAPLGILNAPTGSGKTRAACAIATHRLLGDKRRLVVIAVPQRMIGHGFKAMPILLPDGTNFDWFLQNDVCVDDDEDKRTKALLAFLTRQHGKMPQDRVILCTHATLVRAFAESREAFRHCLIIVDEAHHIRMAEVEYSDDIVCNGLGNVVSYCLSYRDQYDLQLLLTTATFHRGDRLSIVPPRDEEQFVRFDWPYDKHLESLAPLRSIEYHFALYPDLAYWQVVEQIYRTRVGKRIIYIPHPQNQASTKDKRREVKLVLQAIAKAVDGKVEQSGLFYLIKRPGHRDLIIIDLVEESNRKEKMAYIANESLAEDDLDGIITLGVFKEGANWLWADGAIIVGTRGSLPDVEQTMGRLFRQTPTKGKEAVEVHHLLPFASQLKDKEEVRRNLNDYLKVVYLSLVLENVFSPVKVRISKKGKLLSDLTGTTQLNLVEEIWNRTIAEFGEIADEVADDVTPVCEGFIEIAEEELTAAGLVDTLETAQDMWEQVLDRMKKVSGLKASDVEYDLIRFGNPLGYFMHLTSGPCGISTFRELKQLRGREDWWSIFNKVKDDGIENIKEGHPYHGWLRHTRDMYRQTKREAG